MERERSYLIRYGAAGQVGRFMAETAEPYERGLTVVIRSHRGTELGEVLIEAPLNSAAGGDAHLVEGLARVLRVAGDAEVQRARAIEAGRAACFEACAEVLGDGVWPLDLVDVEPLLDDRRVVLHYLGPHKLDTAGLLAVFRDRCGLDVMFHPVGADEPDDAPEPDGEEHDHDHASGGGCGSGGCGSGGCGSGSGSDSGGCGSCGVKQLMSAARR